MGIGKIVTRSNKNTNKCHRFRPIHDFGYVALDILGLIEEDSGAYTCRAANLAGQAQIQTLLEVKSKRLTSDHYDNKAKKVCEFELN